MRKIPKTDPKTGRILRQHKLVTAICACGKDFKTSEDRLADGRGKFCSKVCMYKYRNPKPIKETAKYSALHKWVAAKLGQPLECENCGVKGRNTYQFHWANISGSYDRDLTDWARLCAKCHWHYDREGIIIQNLVGAR